MGLRFCRGADLSKRRQIWASHLATPRVTRLSHKLQASRAVVRPFKVSLCDTGRYYGRRLISITTASHTPARRANFARISVRRQEEGRRKQTRVSFPRHGAAAGNGMKLIRRKRGGVLGVVRLPLPVIKHFFFLSRRAESLSLGNGGLRVTAVQSEIMASVRFVTSLEMSRARRA